MNDDTRDRLVALEVEVKHLRTEFADTKDKVVEMHTLLLQARGAKWFIIAAAGLGGFLSAKLSAIIPWLPLPK